MGGRSGRRLAVSLGGPPLAQGRDGARLHERAADPPRPRRDRDGDFATARAALEYKWKLSKTSEFSEEASFVEDLSDSKDWRFANKVSLGAGVTTVLSVKLSYAWLTLNEPVPGKKKTDTITSAALVAKF